MKHCWGKLPSLQQPSLQFPVQGEMTPLFSKGFNQHNLLSNFLASKQFNIQTFSRLSRGQMTAFSKEFHFVTVLASSQFCVCIKVIQCLRNSTSKPNNGSTYFALWQGRVYYSQFTAIWDVFFVQVIAIVTFLIHAHTGKQKTQNSSSKFNSLIYLMFLYFLTSPTVTENMTQSKQVSVECCFICKICSRICLWNGTDINQHMDWISHRDNSVSPSCRTSCDQPLYYWRLLCQDCHESLCQVHPYCILFDLVFDEPLATKAVSTDHDGAGRYIYNFGSHIIPTSILNGIHNSWH